MKCNKKIIICLATLFMLIGCSNNSVLKDGFTFSNGKPISSMMCAYKMNKKSFKLNENIEFEVYLGYRGEFKQENILVENANIVIYDCDKSVGDQELIYETILEGFFTDEKNYLGYLNVGDKLNFNFSTAVSIEPEKLTRDVGTLRVCGMQYFDDGDSSDRSCKIIKYEKDKKIKFAKR